MASDPQRTHRVPWWWFAAALALLALHTALAYGLHWAAGFSSILLLVLVAERGWRERSLRRELSDVRKAVVAQEDVSTRMASEALTRKQSDQLRRLASIANTVSGAHDVRSVLNLIASGACELVDAGVAAMHVVTGDDDDLDLDVEARATEGCRPTLRAGRSQWRAAPCGQLPHAMSLSREDLEASAEWRAFLDAIGYADAPAGWLGAPLLGLDARHLGALHLIARREPFTERDASIVAQMARLAAGAIENAWLCQELREGDRRKDEFLATLSHELRNPLAPMRSAVEIIKRAPDEAARRAATGVLERQVLHMVRLIDDLLDISRITMSKLDLQCDLVDLADVIRDAAEATRPAIDAAKHSLLLALPSRPVVVRADRARLSQAFANLLHNAARHSEARGTIEVSVESSEREIVVRVRDTGIGIAPELLPHVFDMFVQAAQTLDRPRGGLGIGLALVRSIVELHGGRVNADSGGVDKGSTFTVRLPLSASSTVRTEATEAAARPARARRILVVDDNDDAVDSLAALLRLEGHEVRVGRDGPSAVAVASSFEPDVALLDIGLPGMSGYDVARAMRADARTAQCLLVALSGWGQEADRKRSREAGFDRHLVKPLDIASFNEWLDHAPPEHRGNT